MDRAADLRPGSSIIEYDPFVRGPCPVGVRTGCVTDARRHGRQLPFEVWYPAALPHAGLDLDPATQDRFVVMSDTSALPQAAARDAVAAPGRVPLIVFSHTSGGHRRESSFLCTHLASHGYVVAAADHVGTTAFDVAERAARAATGELRTPAAVEARAQRVIADRVPDLRLLLDALLAGVADEVSRQIDDQRIGLVGWSFGGWAVLATPEVDDRVRAVVALAPAGNSNPLPGIIPATLTFAWTREVSTLFLVAERDRFTPLVGQYELLERAPFDKRMVILRQADHQHFGDQIDDAGRCPPEAAHVFARSLTLAHFDAVLKGRESAERFLKNDLATVLRQHGVDVISGRAGG